MKVVPYYRTHPSEPAASDQALREQHDAVARWAADNADVTVLSGQTEGETDGFTRPALRAAMADCRTHGASLLIASSDAIGSGQPFYHRIMSIPVETAPKIERTVGYVRAAPAEAPTGLSLDFFPSGELRATPIYLCNRTGQAMRDVTILSRGVHPQALVKVEQPAPDGEPAQAPSMVHYETPLKRLPVADLTDQTAVLIDHYDHIIDGDFIVGFEVTYLDKTTTRQSSRVFIGTGGPKQRFIKLPA